MATILTLLTTLFLAYTVWTLHAWYRNYRLARRSGFPILVTPANTDNLIWIIFSVTCRPLLAKLPAFIYDRLLPAIYGWEFLYKRKPFDQVGDSFMMVTPGKNELWVADSDVAMSICSRRNAFVQLPISNREPLYPEGRRVDVDLIDRYYWHVRP